MYQLNPLLEVSVKDAQRWNKFVAKPLAQRKTAWAQEFKPDADYIRSINRKLGLGKDTKGPAKIMKGW